jgi:cyclohexadieny/prephenate dehydrogenase
MRFEQLTIVGVGLIGGSVGLAAKEAGVARRVVGVGRDERTLARAVAQGAIDRAAADLAEGAADADLVVVCTPVDRVARDVLAAAAAAKPRAILTDAGSTKLGILRDVEAGLPPRGPMFVGSHPLAGSEKRGSAHGRADLFRDKLDVVTPTAKTDPEAAAVVELFWQRLGARVVRMDAAEHDKALAVTSHLPHAAAAALAGVTPPAWLGLTAGGFRDTTRVAGGDPALWAAIFQANRDETVAATDLFLDRMARFRAALVADDGAALTQWLAEGKQVRDALGS